KLRGKIGQKSTKVNPDQNTLRIAPRPEENCKRRDYTARCAEWARALRRMGSRVAPKAESQTALSYELRVAPHAPARCARGIT
ncbi:hypothetical protein A2U01_0067013, partial [Trifolium medium]|nr:hypothetical protein [Trifolium medium]